MAEEMESPTEQAQEDMHHHAEHSTEKWIGWVALTAAFLAALAAVTGLMAGDHANEALIEQVQASDKWTEYQAQKIKAMIAALDKPINEATKSKLEEREKKADALKEKAMEYQTSAHNNLEQHKTLAPGVTMFQIAIAMAAITVLSKRKPIWYVSLAFGALGIYYLVVGTMLFHPHGL